MPSPNDWVSFVHVLPEGFVCANCPLRNHVGSSVHSHRRYPGGWFEKDRSRMLGHLFEHVFRGHRVQQGSVCAVLDSGKRRQP